MSDTPPTGIRALIALGLEFLLLYFPIFVIITAGVGMIGYLITFATVGAYNPYETVPTSVLIALVGALPPSIYFLIRRRANRYPGKG